MKDLFLLKFIKDLKKRFFTSFFAISVVNLIFIFFQIIYITTRYEYINSEIPLWYTRLWGEQMLAKKHLLYIFPFLTALLGTLGSIAFFSARKIYIRFPLFPLILSCIFGNIILTYAMFKIIFAASTPFPAFMNPFYLDLVIPFLVALISGYFIMPKFIETMFNNKIVTDPAFHSAPGMLLKAPTARGGGILFSILFIVVGVLFVGFNKNSFFLFVTVGLLGVIALIDDIQNTSVLSKFKFFENPLIRLLTLFVIVLFSTLSGNVIKFVSLPFSSIFNFNSSLIAIGFTVLWIVWVLNVLSWSNGIDGQFSGIITIASFFIALLALRFDNISKVHIDTATLALIMMGLSLGFTKYMWHPSKIMWGFGAISAGFILSYLSIMINTKISTSILIIAVPFIDGVFTFLRRVYNGKNPLKGDRGHLHHLLLNRGWSIPKAALFYWVVTFFIGLLGYITLDFYAFQTFLIIFGVLGFLLGVINFYHKKV